MNSLHTTESGSPIYCARELMYAAVGEPDPQQRIALARQAIETSHDCPEAYVLLAEEAATSLIEAMELYRQGMLAGERALGTLAFAENRGDFWKLVNTRPYMRARFGLAQSLWRAGRDQEAIEHMQDMLRLNPTDNQGVRRPLVTCLMAAGRNDDAQGLLEAYGDDPMALWQYSRALLAFRREGDSSSSRLYRDAALESNPHIPKFLAGRRPMPEDLPDHIGFGDEDEAISYVADNGKLWQDTPGAIAWLVGDGA